MESVILLLKAFELAQEAGLRVIVTDNAARGAERWETQPIYSNGKTPLLIFNVRSVSDPRYVARSILWSVARSKGAKNPQIDQDYIKLVEESRAMSKQNKKECLNNGTEKI